MAALLALPALPAHAATSVEAITLDGAATSATDSTPVRIEADLYLPAETPAPAVLLAHGFGGNKGTVGEEAALLADAGYVVLTYSARGFGGSTGQISVNAPQYEVADAQRLLDYLATLPTVVQDAPGDPRVGVAGGSYGGALALSLAGYDQRIDAVASDITWNSLQDSLVPQSAMGIGDLGVYKQLWTALFFATGLTGTDNVTTCGRFTPEWCDAYSEVATTGSISASTVELMRASSPASVLDRITAPTLIGGGQADSLFPLDQASANALGIMNANPDVPVKVVWHAGGHDGGIAETERLRDLTSAWMDQYLRGGPEVGTAFEYSLVEASALSDRAAGTAQVFSASAFPGLTGATSTPIPISGPPQRILAPAGGLPAAITSLPGAGGLAGLAGALIGLPLPNQSATFVTEPLPGATRIVGAPTVTLSVRSDAPVDNVTLFASVRIVGAADRLLLPNGLVAPIRLDSVGPEPTTVEIELPAVVTEAAAGQRLAVVVGTTDQGYRMSAGPAVYEVALADTALTVPSVPGTPVSVGTPLWFWPAVGLGVVVVAMILVVLLRPRYRGEPMRAELTGTPLATIDLVKSFRKGPTAVDGVTFTVPRGVVLGLLGPNGAGKTTTMRMAMGLIRPTAGLVYVFGQRVEPGAAVLSRVGAFVEGPGFLPHLTGRQNLDLYWRASGRHGQDPHLDEVLDVAGLGSAIDRKVRTYSQGMRQRLGIAQAMLGLPDLLVLDEPTNGLDPPQIREMRAVMRDYATAGRTVIVSSHLLSEVEQTCSHVVVMNHGRVISQGTVAELLGGRTGLRLEDVFLELVGEGHTVEA